MSSISPDAFIARGINVTGSLRSWLGRASYMAKTRGTPEDKQRYEQWVVAKVLEKASQPNVDWLKEDCVMRSQAAQAPPAHVPPPPTVQPRPGWASEAEKLARTRVMESATSRLSSLTLTANGQVIPRERLMPALFQRMRIFDDLVNQGKLSYSQLQVVDVVEEVRKSVVEAFTKSAPPPAPLQHNSHHYSPPPIPGMNVSHNHYQHHHYHHQQHHNHHQQHHHHHHHRAPPSHYPYGGNYGGPTNPSPSHPPPPTGFRQNPHHIPPHQTAPITQPSSDLLNAVMIRPVETADIAEIQRRQAENMRRVQRRRQRSSSTDSSSCYSPLGSDDDDDRDTRQPARKRSKNEKQITVASPTSDKEMERMNRFAKQTATSAPGETKRRKDGKVVGTSKALERRYTREEPRGSDLRPLSFLKEAFAHIVRKGLNPAEGTPPFEGLRWLSDQLKGMRQDIQVQRISNGFALYVYEVHARVCLNMLNLNDFIQCQAAIKGFLDRGVAVDRSACPKEVAAHYVMGAEGESDIEEFQCLRLLYLAFSGQRDGVADELRTLTGEHERNLTAFNLLCARASGANKKISAGTSERARAFLVEVNDPKDIAKLFNEDQCELRDSVIEALINSHSTYREAITKNDRGGTLDWALTKLDLSSSGASSSPTFQPIVGPAEGALAETGVESKLLLSSQAVRCCLALATALDSPDGSIALFKELKRCHSLSCMRHIVQGIVLMLQSYLARLRLRWLMEITKASNKKGTVCVNMLASALGFPFLDEWIASFVGSSYDPPKIADRGSAQHGTVTTDAQQLAALDQWRDLFEATLKMKEPARPVFPFERAKSSWKAKSLPDAERVVSLESLSASVSEHVSFLSGGSGGAFAVRAKPEGV